MRFQFCFPLQIQKKLITRIQVQVGCIFVHVVVSRLWITTMESTTNFTTTANVGSKKNEPGFQMDFWISLDMFLAVYPFIYIIKNSFQEHKIQPKPAIDTSINFNNHNQTSSNKHVHGFNITNNDNRYHNKQPQRFPHITTTTNTN